MKLFIVHAGYYDDEIGIYELHTNFLIAAVDVSAVKRKVKEKDIFKKKKMHIDAVQEIDAIDGYKVVLIEDDTTLSKITNYNYTQIKKLVDSA